MESRAFLHSAGPMHQLFEIISDDRGKPCPPRLELIEDLEGMDFHIGPGARNRLGIVTTAGEAYVLDKRSVEVELVEAPGDVRLLGLGSDFEVVVTEQEEVFVRGSSELWCRKTLTVDQFGQLGLGDTESEADFVQLKVDGKVASINCSRWATILTMQPTT